MTVSLQHEVGALLARFAGTEPRIGWSVSVLRSGEPVVRINDEVVHRTASLGKVLLLIAVAEEIAAGRVPADQALPRPVQNVADSGLWQYLSDRSVPTLTVADAAVLVGAVSDNLACNALLDHVGLASVDAVATRLGLASARQLDRIRDERTSHDPVAPSVGSTADYVRVMHAIGTGAGLAPDVAALVAGWLATGTDLSMVAGALGLDPLAHATDGLVHKTGTDERVRADVGYWRRTDVAYAVFATWHESPVHVRAVLDVMRDIGALVLA